MRPRHGAVAVGLAGNRAPSTKAENIEDKSVLWKPMSGPFGAHAGPLVHEALPNATASAGPADGSARSPMPIGFRCPRTPAGPARQGRRAKTMLRPSAKTWQPVLRLDSARSIVPTAAPMISQSTPLSPSALPRIDAKWILIAGSVALAAWLSLVPVAFLLWQSFLTPETAAVPARFTWENYGIAYYSAETVRLFGNSIAFGVGSSAVAFVSGTFFAWVNERTNTPFKSLFFALSLIPLVIPAI